jgi:predicted PurR-regulated permease PerM
VLLVFFAAAIFAVPLRAAALGIARRARVSATAGLAAVLALVVLAVAAIVWGWETLIAAQAAQLMAALPAAAASVAHALREEPWASRISALTPDPGVLLTGAGGLVGALRGFLGGTLAGLVNVAILIFAAVCFAAEPRTYVDGLLRLVPPPRRARVDAVLAEAGGTIAFWLAARLISMVTIATISGVGLALLGIPDALALGFLAGILAFVPNVGPIAAAVPSLLLAAPLGWQRAFAVVVLYWLAHAFDDFLVIPIAERRVVRLPPALTIAAQLVLGLASGVLGIMLAAPFVAVCIVLVRRLVVEDVVERDSTRPADPGARAVPPRAPIEGTRELRNR